VSSKLLRWATLPVTDRRWAAPLSAVALGFGLFAGVAIGPGATGTFATGAAQIIEIPSFIGSADTGDEGEEGGGSASLAGSGGESGGGSFGEAESSLPPLSPVEEGSESTEPTKPSSPSEKSPSSEAKPKPEKQTLTGIVVHVNPAAGSYAIAEPGGALDVVHAGKAPQPGTEVSVPTRLLSNGTFAEAGTRTRSRIRSRATLSGIVTYVDPTPTAPAYTISKRGISVLVHVHPDPTGIPPALPVLGAFAKVAVDIEKPQPPVEPVTAALPPEPAPVPPPEPAQPAPAAPPVTPAPAPPATPAPAPAPPSCAPDPTLPPLPPIQPAVVLWQRQISAPGAPFTAGDFAGIVEAVCPDTGQILISADDIRASQHDLVFAVPVSIDTTKLEPGQSVLATATIAPDGALALTGLASDERTKGADDIKAAQGDLVPSKPK
jgi:hypothetical protein